MDANVDTRHYVAVGIAIIGLHAQTCVVVSTPAASTELTRHGATPMHCLYKEKFIM